MCILTTQFEFLFALRWTVSIDINVSLRLLILTTRLFQVSVYNFVVNHWVENKLLIIYCRNHFLKVNDRSLGWNVQTWMDNLLLISWRLFTCWISCRWPGSINPYVLGLNWLEIMDWSVWAFVSKIVINVIIMRISS